MNANKRTLSPEVDYVYRREGKAPLEVRDMVAQEQEEQLAFAIVQMVEFTRRFDYGKEWPDLGHRCGRVTGRHQYLVGQARTWCYSLAKFRLDKHSGRLVSVGTPTRPVMIYMVPEWTLEAYPAVAPAAEEREPNEHH